MLMRSVFSSHVYEIGYDQDSMELHVRYNGPGGKLAVYKDVDPQKAHAVMSSASIGEALHEHIRGAHDYEYR